MCINAELKLRAEPTERDLEDLQRIADRRAEIAGSGLPESGLPGSGPPEVETDQDGPAHRRQRKIRRLLLDTLDEMEEELCLYGWRAPAVVEGWRKLACFDSSRRNGLDSGRSK